MEGFFHLEKKYDLGLVGCSKKKLTVPAPAKFLYSASSLFSLLYQTANRECQQVWIVSAKYGSIHPEQWIAPYDMTLPPGDLEKWAMDSVQTIGGYDVQRQSVAVYASGVYLSALLELNLGFVAGGFAGLSIWDRCKELGKVGRLKPFAWPMEKLLEMVYLSGHQGAPIQDIERLMPGHWCLATRMAQMERVLKCPLHKRVDGRLVSLWWEQTSAGDG